MKSELIKTDFGVINKKWTLIPFENITINQQNGLYKPKEFQGKGTKIVKMGNQYGHPRIYNQDMDRYDLTTKELEKFQLNYDDLLFSRRSLVFEGAGECSIVKERKEPLIFESSIIRVSLNKKIALPDFFFYFFQSHLGKQIIRSINQGTSVAGITGADLKKILVPLPNIQEQKNIIQIFVRLDDKIENLQNQNKVLEQIAQTIFKSWFIDFDGMTEFEDSELGKIPKGWKVVNFSEISEITSGKRPDFISEVFTELYKIPLYGASGIMGYVKNALYQKPIILTGRVGTIGIVQNIFEECYPSDNTLVILPIKDFFHHYIVNFLKMVDFESIKGGSTQPLITQTSLKNLDCIIPEKNILEKFERISKNFQLTSNLKKYQITELSKIRDSLLPKLMSGEIRV